MLQYPVEELECKLSAHCTLYISATYNIKKYHIEPAYNGYGEEPSYREFVSVEDIELDRNKLVTLMFIKEDEEYETRIDPKSLYTAHVMLREFADELIRTNIKWDSVDEYIEQELWG